MCSDMTAIDISNEDDVEDSKDPDILEILHDNKSSRVDEISNNNEVKTPKEKKINLTGINFGKSLKSKFFFKIK